MHAIRSHGYADNDEGVDTLRFEEVERPTPGDGEVLVRMTLASVNPVDWKLLDGHLKGVVDLAFPFTPGGDGCGVVEAAGGGFDAGERVSVLVSAMAGGAYAELLVAKPEELTRVPEGLSDEQAAALPLAGLTAWQAVKDRIGIRAGQTLLVLGASGVVGQAAVQIAKRDGAVVTGVGSGANRDLVEAAGADRFIDYKETDLSTLEGFDACLDAAGGDATADGLRAVKRGGVFISVTAEPDADAMEERGLTGGMHWLDPKTGQLAELLALAAGGGLTVSVDATLPLSEAADALKKNRAGDTRGKVLLRI